MFTQSLKRRYTEKDYLPILKFPTDIILEIFKKLIVSIDSHSILIELSLTCRRFRIILNEADPEIYRPLLEKGVPDLPNKCIIGVISKYAPRLKNIQLARFEVNATLPSRVMPNFSRAGGFLLTSQIEHCVNVNEADLSILPENYHLREMASKIEKLTRLTTLILDDFRIMYPGMINVSDFNWPHISQLKVFFKNKALYTENPKTTFHFNYLFEITNKLHSLTAVKTLRFFSIPLFFPTLNTLRVRENMGALTIDGFADGFNQLCRHIFSMGKIEQCELNYEAMIGALPYDFTVSINNQWQCTVKIYRYLYRGPLKDFLPEGDGELLDSKGVSVFKGKFTQGFIEEGEGTLLIEDSYYTGKLLDGTFEGQVTVVDPKKNIYIGPSPFEKRTVAGTLTTASNIVYEGEFQQGVLEGMGKLKYPNGEEFIGNFDNGQPKSGFGYLEGKDFHYKGFYKLKSFHGQGVLWEKGKITEGEFDYGLPVGKMKVTVPPSDPIEVFHPPIDRGGWISPDQPELPEFPRYFHEHKFHIDKHRQAEKLYRP